MRIVVIGAGAVGSYVAGKLAQAKADVTLVARGAALEAIGSNGIRIEGEESFSVSLPVVSPDHTIEPADIVIGCVKAYAIPEAAPLVARLLKPDGAWICGQNGIPWWFADGAEAASPRLVLDSVDPGRRIATAVPRGQTIGAVMYVRSMTKAPGVTEYAGGRGFIIGELGGAVSDRTAAAAATLKGAGIGCEVTGDIRSAVWGKLFGNISLNPLSAVTGCTVGRMLAEPRLAAFLLATIEEGQRVAVAAGSVPDMTPAQRLAAMERLLGFRTSMLQDAEAGRTLELDAILAAPVEIARKLGIAVPGLELLLALTSAFAEARGLLPAKRT
jgi:2-dehydropantoate 2-reductase